MSKADEIWTTRDGKEIKVKDMTTQHIKNTIKCLEEGRVGFVVNCGYASDNDYIEYDEDTWTKEYWIELLKKELERRKM